MPLRYRSLLMLAAGILVQHMAQAGLLTYIFTQDPWTVWQDEPHRAYSNSFRGKTMTLAPTNWYLMKMRANDLAPLDGVPSTNLWPGGTNSWMPEYAYGAGGTPLNNGWYTHVGQDYSGELPDTGQPGTLYSDVDGSVLQYGTLRLFSASTVTGAAYFGTVKPYRSFGVSGDDFKADPVCTVASNVNPAYVIPLTVTDPPDFAEFAQTPYPAAGTIPVGDGDNVLPHGLLTVAWYNVSLGTGGLAAVNADGSWSAAVAISNQTGVTPFTNEVQIYASALSVRPGLPLSPTITRQIIGVPEPLTWLGMLLGGCLVRRRPYAGLSLATTHSSWSAR